MTGAAARIEPGRIGRRQQGNRRGGAARLHPVFVPTAGPSRDAAGSRYGHAGIDKRNTALAGDYLTCSAGIGYRAKNVEFRLDGTNLTDRRPPVSESELGESHELGESQYYRLPARRVDLTARWTWD